MNYAITFYLPAWLTSLLRDLGYDVEAVLQTVNNYIKHYGLAFTVAVIVSLVLLVLSFIAQCVILHKARKGWAWNFVPIARDYVQLSVPKMGYAFWTTFVLSVVDFGVFFAFAQLKARWLGIAGLVIFGVLLVISLIFYIIYCVRLSRVFGHGLGYALGLIFLPTLFAMILAFGSSQYVPLLKKAGQEAN